MASDSIKHWDSTNTKPYFVDEDIADLSRTTFTYFVYVRCVILFVFAKDSIRQSKRNSYSHVCTGFMLAQRLTSSTFVNAFLHVFLISVFVPSLWMLWCDTLVIPAIEK